MKVLQILERLVRFPTLPQQPNVELLDYVAEHLRAVGVEPQFLREPGGERGGLVAVIGPSVPGGIVLSAHADVVSVDGQHWTVPPWQLTVRDDRLYGRGTADMKGFIACCLELLPDLDLARLSRPLILAISHDEEIGCVGAPLLVKHIAQHVPRPAAVIVGEPTSMRVVHGHKGVAVYETSVRGRAAHSSLTHTAASATLAGGQLVVRLGEIAARLRDGGRRDEAFVPPYTTVNVGIVRGGEASNIVAAACMLRWDVRPIPGDDPGAILAELQEYCDATVLPAMRRTTAEAEIKTEVFASAPPLSPAMDPAAHDLVLSLLKEDAASIVSFTTEAGLFQQAGMSAIVCGPGSIEQAHKPDEFVERAQLEACSRLLRSLVDDLSH